MPTGYTAKILDGASFEQFVWSCARAMGAFIMQRDDASDAPPELDEKPSEYHEEAREKARRELADFNAATPAKLGEMYDAYITGQLEAKAKSEEKDRKQEQAYRSMLAKVQAWDPPTPEHAGLKKFMVDQIEESIRFDCAKPDRDWYAVKPYSSWVGETLEKLEADVVYHTNHLRDDIERADKRNAWKRQLAASVPVPTKA
jgi:hypothetical protein